MAYLEARSAEGPRKDRHQFGGQESRAEKNLSSGRRTGEVGGELFGLG